MVSTKAAHGARCCQCIRHAAWKTCPHANGGAAARMCRFASGSRHTAQSSGAAGVLHVAPMFVLR